MSGQSAATREPNVTHGPLIEEALVRHLSADLLAVLND
jgi:hypothetical protein